MENEEGWRKGCSRNQAKRAKIHEKRCGHHWAFIFPAIVTHHARRPNKGVRLDRLGFSLDESSGVYLIHWRPEHLDSLVPFWKSRKAEERGAGGH